MLQSWCHLILAKHELGSKPAGSTTSLVSSDSLVPPSHSFLSIWHWSCRVTPPLVSGQCTCWILERGCRGKTECHSPQPGTHSSNTEVVTGQQGYCYRCGSEWLINLPWITTANKENSDLNRVWVAAKTWNNTCEKKGHQSWIYCTDSGQYWKIPLVFS